LGHQRGHVKASRPLIRVLIINDNIYGLTISWEEMSIGWSMRKWAHVDAMRRLGDDIEGYAQGKGIR
jgi:hypothetical protein